MTDNRSAITSIGEHHAFLHGPGVIAAHESDKAVVAIVAAGEVRGVHDLAFDEKCVELGQRHARSTIIVPQSEAEVRRLGQPRSVEIRHLSLPHGRFVEPPVETGNTSRLPEIVLNDRPHGGSHVVFVGFRESEFPFSQYRERAAQDSPDEQDHRKTETRVR